MSLYQASKSRLMAQLVRGGITDARVLAAMQQVPRECFVSEAFSDQAYEDVALPIDDYQTISQPSMVARMTQALALNERSVVLEIGTGSGYQAAILAHAARWVHSIERHERLFKQARERLASLGLENICLHHADGCNGWPHAAPYEHILVTCAAFEQVPPALLAQLSATGVMVVPIEQNGQQTLCRIHKEGETFVQQPLCPVRFVPLVAA